MRWSLEPATHGAGKWLVGRDENRVEVIGAPGTRIPSAERHPERSDPQVAGWRHASWERSFERRLNLDRDAPDSELRAISTREVLELVDARLHGSVRTILARQLAHVEAMDLLPAMTQHPGYERAAHRHLSAIAWVHAELAEAFPEDFPHLRNPTALVKTTRSASSEAPPEATLDTVGTLEVPDTVAALESQLQTNVYSKGLGGHELWRLLKRRVMWRLMEKLPRAILVALFACSRDGRESHELVTRMLTERAFQSDWPLITRLDRVEGRIQRILAIGWPQRHNHMMSHGETTISLRRWLRVTARARKIREQPQRAEENSSTHFSVYMG